MSPKKNTRTSFGATAPPFIDYLKDILNRYPDGGQILKELIQNADDAKATEVIFIHDERTYGTESLWTDELREYQGPALYAYNNAAFTSEDWQSIQKAGRSDKRNDPNKVGRFGIGFNSVYHTTDLPCIFSSGHLGIMDPQENIFGEKEGGFLWSLDDPDHQEDLMTLHDQFQPFRDIVSLACRQEWAKVVMDDQHFEGTIFRFPLRNKASEISGNLYDSHKVVDLFDSFIADAELSLLFLRNVTSVSLVHVGADGTVNTRLRVRSTELTDSRLESKRGQATNGFTRFKMITCDSGRAKETKWLVTSCTMEGGHVAKLDALANKLSFLPQVDLAFPCGERKDCSQGRLSCFLPLPNNESNKTGFPVFVNACFGLTDNRRLIKWQEEDQKHDEHAVWNELLVSEVLPLAYVMAIQHALRLAQQSSLPVSAVYSLMPDISQVEHKEKWHAVALNVLRHLFREDVALLSLARDERQFVTLSQAVLTCNGPTSPAVLSAIESTLIHCGENIVTLPSSVAKAINVAYPKGKTLRHVTPPFMRDVLRRVDIDTLSKANKLCLLEYVLNDGKYRELKDLQLLPLSDGSFRSFTDREEDIAFVDSDRFPRTLLPCCKTFIPDDLSPACKTHLKEMARQDLFNIINLNADHVAEWTRKHLPQEWKQQQTGTVNWDIGSHHPPLDWLQHFWEFLNSHFQELSRFSGIPLIPVSPLSNGQPVLLARLESKTTLIFQQRKQMRLPEQIAQIINKAGGTVVKANEWLKHEDLDSYVLCPSPKSVMSLLMNLDFQKLVTNLESVSLSSQKILKDYLSRLDSPTYSEIDFLKRLPLFQSMKGSCVAAQSKQAILLMSGLKIPTEFPFPDSVVQCTTEADRRLLQLLSVQLLDTAEAASLLIDCVESRTLVKKDNDKIMAWILEHGNILFSQNPTLKHKCKDLSFIEVKGELKRASSLFDPTVQTFKVIFDSDYFPPAFYTQTTQMQKSLTDLGLINKEVDVLPEHLLHVVQRISQLNGDAQSEGVKRAQATLKMLDTHDLLSRFSAHQLHNLQIIKWVPCVKPSNGHKSCTKGFQESCFFSPDEIRHSMYEDIVGHVMPLEGKFGDRLCNRLGFKRLPPPEKVKENLSVLIKRAKTMADPDSNVDFKRQLRGTYEHMQNHISEFKRVIDEDMHLLWSNNKFVAPKDLVLDYPRNLDLSSYVGKVPKEFLPYKKLLHEFGLRTSLTDDEIVGILERIQQSIETRQEPFASSEEIQVSVEILNWLWREKKTVQEDIPVPALVTGEHYTLKPLSQVVFCDVSKNGLNELRYSQEDIPILHEEIPKATAEWLNIQFLSTYILSPELVGIEQCGQSEPITTRIKNILKEYDDERDIFKELIQNAEDAGAKVCKFLVDFRVHRDSPDRLIDPDMTLCQGPCLWAYNDEKFTAEDWKNIVSVGAASKENKVEKIGKFGLGFNTVYHLTDIPSILSGNSLLILDPNVTHLTKHIKNRTNPGIKLNLSQQRLLHCFPGQFGPYNGVFDCDLTKPNFQSYQGTLIKLPFRTEEEALKSEISNKIYHSDKIVSLQKCFTENSYTQLLFLKNIQTLSLQQISKKASTPIGDSEIETVLTVSKTEDASLKMTDHSYVSKQHRAEASLMKLNGKCTEVIDSCKVKIITLTIKQGECAEVQRWLLYNCIGTNQALEMALQKTKQAKFSLPIGGVAVPLQIIQTNGEKVSYPKGLAGQAFCSLPLPIHTGLPINVNGTFAVTSNRKGLWESGVKQEWNNALLQDPVVAAYITALLELKTLADKNNPDSYSYHIFWPDREKVSPTFKPLVDKFYTIVAQQPDGPKLFSDGEHWCSMSSAIFLHESIESDKTIGMLVVQVCKEHVKAPNHIVPLPQWLRESFRKAGLQKVLESRTWNWEKFYQETVFNHLDGMDPKTRDALISYAIDLNIPEIDKLLLSYPCIPTKSGKLQHIKKLVNPLGKVACLFELEGDRLLDSKIPDFSSPKRIQRLLELGMINDNLSVKEITEKAGTIAKTWSKNRTKAYAHVQCLLDLIKIHMHCEDTLVWETVRMTKFLPAFFPGDLKMGGNIRLENPTNIFSDTCSLLVNMTQPVLDHGSLKMHSTDPVLQFLGVQNRPRPEAVLDQLQEVCKQSQSIDRSMLHKIAHECYKFLNQWLIDTDDSSLILQRAKSFPFILVGNTFANVSQVVEKELFEAKPFLYALPLAFSDFNRLWKSVGVEKHFTVHQFESVLKELHTKHRKKPLPNSDLSICLTILTRGIYHGNKKIKGACLIPNEKGVLQPANKMFYNDSAWMPVPPNVTLCHKSIARDMAVHFGIKTTRHRTLQNHVAEDILPFSIPFGQQEKLTVRIKNIISAYPSKKDILKELLQNADDAEATEIHFVWDKRDHGKNKTFGEKWNHLQGPALCVFNNSVFSDADFRGIQQLGEGGKHNSTGKTGKYGIGFNSVYHLTDCPSILTGDKTLMISDPNQNYIENHTGQARDGIAYKLADDFKEMYEDVYTSFLPDKFQLQGGTMFRLPLRRGVMANESQICQQGVTDHDMDELCSELGKDPEGLILFLQNISKICVHEINPESDTLTTLFTVEKSLPQSSMEKKHAFTQKLQDALRSEKPTLIESQKVIYGSVVSTSNSQSKWVIAQQFGSSKDSIETGVTSDILPHAAVAARVNSKSDPCLIQPAEKILQGGAFCSLPLPGKTGLPVHVNANFEVDSARRSLWKEDGLGQKSEWNEYLKRDIIAPLYAALLHYLSSTFTHKKLPFSALKERVDASYLHFWPTVSKDTSQEWHTMIHEVYRSLKAEKLNVIPAMRSSVRVVAHRELKEYSLGWCNVSETETTEAPYLTAPLNSELNPILEDLGMMLVPYTDEMDRVWKSFKSAGVEVRDVNPSTVQAFLKEKPLNDAPQMDEALPLPITATLLRDEERCSKLLSFCLSEFEKGYKKVTDANSSFLEGLPLLLTKDKFLRVFDSKSPKLISQHESLFCGNEDKFADYKTNGKHTNILHRFGLVKCLTIPCAVPHLKPVLQDLLQKCEIDQDSGLHIPNEQIVKWLEKLWKFLMGQINSFTAVESNDQKNLPMSDVKQFFKGCSILPVVCPRLKNKCFLERIETMPSVIHFASESDKSGLLFKLGLMKLNTVFFSDKVVDPRQFNSIVHDELMNVKDQTVVLNHVHGLHPLEFTKLSTTELNELQCFLQDGLSKSKDKQDYEMKLRSMPIFQTIHGTRVSIRGSGVFILDSQHSVSFPNLFTLNDGKSTFLQNNFENMSLSRVVKIQILSDLDYFVRFILPIAHTLNEIQLIQSLKLLLTLQNDQHYFSMKDKIISTLQSVKLIRSSQGKLEAASYYYDEDVRLYKKMLPEEKFVPDRFWTELCQGSHFLTSRSKQLIKDLGMKHALSKSELIEFACQLESKAKENNYIDDLKEKSTMILAEALSLLAKDKEQRFLGRLANIKFIYPVKIQEDLCKYHQPFATEQTAVALSGSLIEGDSKHPELVWTSMPIIHLPVYKSTELMELVANAGAHEQPPSHCVIRNMCNICQSPCKTEDLIQTRAHVFRSLYTYLQANEFDQQPLSALPVVLVERDTLLVRTDDACISLDYDSEFRPYLYKTLTQDIRFSDFFLKIGVKPKPNAVHYCNVLAAIYSESFDKPQLNPNQLKTVKRAVQQFFTVIRTPENQSYAESVKDLYFPAVDGKLHTSHTLSYNNTCFEVKRLESALKNKVLLLQRLSECHLGKDPYEHNKLIQLLPEKFRPKMLSELTNERVVDVKMQLCELGLDCEFSGWFEKHLSSPPFRHGLICLIREQSHGQITQEDAADMCTKTFGSIKIVCCENLETKLWLDEQPLDRTANQIDVFVKPEQETCIFYLKHNDNMAPKVINHINMTLTKQINALLGHKISSHHLTVLGLLLTCDTLEEVRKALAENGIRDSGEVEGFHFDLPAPGADIPEEWHDSLDMDFLNIFEEGEYVGYSTNDKYIYAVIVEELPGSTSPHLRRFKVDIGEAEPVVVSCLDLYQIKRQKKPKASESSCKDLVLLNGAAPHSPRSSATNGSSSRPLPGSVEEAKREIDKCLEEIWNLPEEERQKAIKRMFLRWHPDKNPDCESLATEAFKYLQNRIEEMHKGNGKRAGSSSHGGGWDFSDFFRQWHEEARKHRRGRERFSRAYRSYNFYSYNRDVPRPNREEAQRWCRQARCDLTAAHRDTGSGSTEWCLFKVHQAVEKALVAAAYRKHGQNPLPSSISAMAVQASVYSDKLRDLPQAVRNLKALGVDDKKTQYPDAHPFPRIPNQQFKSESEVLALDIASKLLGKIEAYVD